MENVLELIKSSESFKKYAKLVKENDDIPTMRKVDEEMRLKFLEFEDALLGLADIEQVDDGYKIHIDSWVGAAYWVGAATCDGTKYGNATYDVLLKNVDDDVFINGNIVMVFNELDTAGFEKVPGTYDINDVVVNETINEVLKNKGSILTSRQI